MVCCTTLAMAQTADKVLLQRLHHLLEKGIMFGHQDDLAYGIGWKYEQGQSDVKLAGGDYPAVYGWDLGHLELDAPYNLDSVPFDKMKQYIRAVHERGGINTLSWHLRNPANGQTAWDTAGRPVAAILPGGNKHSVYTSWLDKVAAFVTDCNVPIVFRPFHEHTGSWFWWGQNHCTTEEFKQLWQFTVRYLKDTKNVHNLLYAYSAADYKDAAHFLERYPGDDYVDVIGTDAYQYNSSEGFQQVLHQRLSILQQIAKERHKIPALTEAGYERVPAADWWTGTLWPAIRNYKLSWVLMWRNGRPDHYYVPWPGQVSEADFKKFRAEPGTLFQQDVNIKNK